MGSALESPRPPPRPRGSPPHGTPPVSQKRTATGSLTGGRRQTRNGSCSPRHTSQFVVRCNQPTRVDVIETSWPAERGCTERFRGKPVFFFFKQKTAYEI